MLCYSDLLLPLNHPKGIDLGLSVKWSNRNVGAIHPEGCGSYFAWGETEPKDSYSLENYRINDEIIKSEHFYSKNSDEGRNLHANHDAATVKWGKPWRMPTLEEIQELSDKCTWKQAERNGIRGYQIYGVNANSIFLPSVGYCSGTSLRMANTHTLYWSSTLCPKHISYCAYILYAYLSQSSTTYYNRCFGLPIRPVMDK